MFALIENFSWKMIVSFNSKLAWISIQKIFQSKRKSIFNDHFNLNVVLDKT